MKSYREFIKESKEDIIISGNTILLDSICRGLCLENYTINSNGTVDVDDDVEISDLELYYLPINFGRVAGNFECSDNFLTSLEGCPTTVGGNFYCKRNKLTSLQGCPEIISGNFYCSNNKITNFKGVSEFFEGKFYCDGNPIVEIYHLFSNNNNIHNYKCIRWINEFDVILDGNKIITDRLEEVFHQLGMVVPENIDWSNYFKCYEII
jgi:hypothetical protein